MRFRTEHRSCEKALKLVLPQQMRPRTYNCNLGMTRGADNRHESMIRKIVKRGSDRHALGLAPGGHAQTGIAPREAARARSAGMRISGSGAVAPRWERGTPNPPGRLPGLRPAQPLALRRSSASSSPYAPCGAA